MFKKKIARFQNCLMLLTFCLPWVYCQDGSVNPIASQDLLNQLTLASLKKVDDYPLYTMTYFGDYGFREFLRTGHSPAGYSNSNVRRDDGTWACTCFAAMGDSDRFQFGRNFDWTNRPSLLLFTHPPEGYASVSMVDLQYLGYNPEHLPDSMQHREDLLAAPYLPFDGMNEKGLAVGMMAVDHAEAPNDPAKVTIGEIQLIRLVLDRAKDVEEAVEWISRYNIRISPPPIHYLLADASGKSAVIEFVGGQMVVIRNTEAWQVSTNFIINGSGAPFNVTCWRYSKVYSSLKNASGKMTRSGAMNLLNQVSQNSTKWSMVYGLQSGEIQAVMGRKYNAPLTFQLRK